VCLGSSVLSFTLCSNSLSSVSRVFLSLARSLSLSFSLFSFSLSSESFGERLFDFEGLFAFRSGECLGEAEGLRGDEEVLGDFEADLEDRLRGEWEERGERPRRRLREGELPLSYSQVM